MKRIRKVVVHITEKAVPKTPVYHYFQRIVVDGVEYWDSLGEYTHEKALELAKQYELRVLESWEMHRLWVECEDFRQSMQPKWYWCASVHSNFRSSAWLFSGIKGFVLSSNRNFSYGVRCVKLEKHPA